MMLITCFAAFSLVGIVLGTGNETVEIGNFKIETLGKSGKIKVLKDDETKPYLTITPDYIGEKTADNQVTDHELQTFAKTDFNYNTPKDEKKYGLNAKTITFNTTFTNKIQGEMVMDIIIFKESGEITVESGEIFDVSVGAVKFNVEINNWKFCNPCKQGNKDAVGAFLDFVMEIKGHGDNAPSTANKQKGRKGNSKAKNPPRTLDLGGSEVIVSSLVKVDGTWKNMTDGYPLIEQKNKKNSFTFRFEKFNSHVYYDPIGQTTESSGGIIKPTLMFLFMAITVTISAIF